MSYNTDLQSHNTKLHSLIEVANNLPDAAIEIGVFTCESDTRYNSIQTSDFSINPFMKGMTWQDFIESPLNYIRYNGLAEVKYENSENYVTILNTGGMTAYLSTSGTESDRIKTSDIITEGHYLTYVKSPMS